MNDKSVAFLLSWLGKKHTVSMIPVGNGDFLVVIALESI